MNFFNGSEFFWALSTFYFCYFCGEDRIILFLLFEFWFVFTEVFFFDFYFLRSFVFFAFYLSFSFYLSLDLDLDFYLTSLLYWEQTDDYLFLLLPFLAILFLSPRWYPLWSTPNKLLCEACDRWDTLWLWWLSKVRVDAWWLWEFLFDFLIYLTYLMSLWCYLGCLFLEFASFGCWFFLRLLLNFFNIQNWLLSIFFILIIIYVEDIIITVFII